jgi:NTP pyrophosphatase (non-canonical NTP hydrolase)
VFEGLNNIATECQRNAHKHGFWDHQELEWEVNIEDGPFEQGYIENPSIWAEKIALMHSEASEMLEALRDGDEEQLAEESADLLIRLFDFTARRGIDIEAAVKMKMEKNVSRPKLHGRKF